MWTLAGHISSAFGLLGLVVAAVVTLYRSALKTRLKAIEAALPETRAELISKELNAFGVKAETLTKQQQYDLALREFAWRTHRLNVTVGSLIIVVTIFSLLAAYGLYVEPNTTPVLDASPVTGIDADLEKSGPRLHGVSCMIHFPPTKMTVCEHIVKDVCSSWMFHNNKFTALWDDLRSEDITIDAINNDEFAFTGRSPDSSADPTSYHYMGELVSQSISEHGCRIEGTLQFDREGKRKEGKWYATWIVIK